MKNEYDLFLEASEVLNDDLELVTSSIKYLMTKEQLRADYYRIHEEIQEADTRKLKKYVPYLRAIIKFSSDEVERMKNISFFTPSVFTTYFAEFEVQLHALQRDNQSLLQIGQKNQLIGVSRRAVRNLLQLRKLLKQTNKRQKR